MNSSQAPTTAIREARITARNAMAEGIDREAVRFSAFCADRLVAHLNPAAGEKILDVSTGSGALALAVSQAVGQVGRVAAVDNAERLLARLEAKISKFGIDNIDVHNMDAARLFPAHRKFPRPHLATGSGRRTS